MRSTSEFRTLWYFNISLIFYYCITGVERGATYIVQHGGLDILSTVLRRHLGRADLQIQGFHLLNSLSREKNSTGRNDEDLVSLICSSMRAHENNIELMTSACNAIGSLAFSST